MKLKNIANNVKNCCLVSKKAVSLGTKDKETMRTMKTMKVYQWLLDNQMFLAAPALVNKFNLMGELEHEVILEFLEGYVRTPSYVFKQMQCQITTTLTIT